MDQAETLAARAAIFGGIMAGALVYLFSTDEGVILLGQLVIVIIATWASYIIGTVLLRRYAPDLS